VPIAPLPHGSPPIALPFGIRVLPIWRVLQTVRKRLVIALAVLLGSCQTDVRVDVRAESNGQLRIEAADQNGRHPCLDDVTISRIVSQRDEPVWGVSLDPPGSACRSTVTYPEVPPGYTGTTPGVALRPGDRYVVSVTASAIGGIGRSAQMQFRQ